jgi:hypothetical protein
MIQRFECFYDNLTLHQIGHSIAMTVGIGYERYNPTGVIG